MGLVARDTGLVHEWLRNKLDKNVNNIKRWVLIVLFILIYSSLNF